MEENVVIHLRCQPRPIELVATEMKRCNDLCVVYLRDRTIASLPCDEIRSWWFQFNQGTAKPYAQASRQ